MEDAGNEFRPWVWYLSGLLLTAFVVVLACAPLFDRPQLQADDYRYAAVARAVVAGGSPELAVVESLDVEVELQFEP